MGILARASLLLATLVGCCSLVAADATTNTMLGPLPRALSLDADASASTLPFPSQQPVIRSLQPFLGFLVGPLVAGCLALVFGRKSLRCRSDTPWSLAALFTLLGILSTWLATRYTGSGGSAPSGFLLLAAVASVAATPVVAFCAVAHYREQARGRLAGRDAGRAVASGQAARLVGELPEGSVTAVPAGGAVSAKPTERCDARPPAEVIAVVDASCAATAEDSSPTLGSRPAADPRLVRSLELLLVVFAACQSGIPVLAFALMAKMPLTRLWPASMTWTQGIQFLLQQTIALGVLGYILYRNSRWSQVCVGRSVHATADASPETDSSVSTNRSGHAVAVSELLLVVVVAFGGSVFGSLAALPGGVPVPADADWTVPWISHVYGMLRQLGALGLLGYVLYRNAQCFRDLGLHWTSRDAAMALPLLLAGFVIHRFYLPLVIGGSQAIAGHELELPDVARLLFGSSVSIATVPAAIVVGFFEELIVRAYLMTVIKRLTRSGLVAVVVSVGLQVSYHFYQGLPLGLSHIGLFLLFSLFYLRTGRILPVILAHALVDLAGLWHHALETTSAL